MEKTTEKYEPMGQYVIQTFELTEWGSELPRYRVEARFWEQSMEFVNGSVYDLTPYVGVGLADEESDALSLALYNLQAEFDNYLWGLNKVTAE